MGKYQLDINQKKTGIQTIYVGTHIYYMHVYITDTCITCMHTLHAYVYYIHTYITWVLFKNLEFKAKCIEITEITVK